MASRLLSQRYRLVEPIGQGGIGTVWRAEDELLHRQVAIKEVRVSRDLDHDKREELLARTMREARICAGLSTHPGIVTIHDVLREDGRPWIVMELVDGRVLDRVVWEDGPLSPRSTAEIGRQLFAALTAAHQGGVLHRDIKPGNVLVLPDGRAMLSDFGIAVSDSEDKITLTGKLPGSPGYIAPERLRTGDMTPAADVWSLGATLYFTVEGHAAFERTSNAERLTAALQELPDPAVRAGSLRPVIYGMLQADPEHRLGGPALETALANVIAGSGAEDPTPTQLDVGAVPTAMATGPNVPLPPGPKTAMRASRVGTLGRKGWVRILISLVAGLTTLILAPLLVEYLSNVLIDDDEPTHAPAGQTSGPADHANPARTDPGRIPEGFVEYEHDGFSIAIPEAWSVEETGAETVISSRDQTDHIRIGNLDLNGATPVEHFEVQERHRSEGPGFRGIKLEEVEHPDGDAAQWMYETGENGTPMMLVELLVHSPEGETAVLVFATGPER
ncbi:serine/threonine-protein kinase [Allosalinactinospora lopnorensis]|uniref:serine/threonine-protein kinase n=1 Tax=Allosalinactinospora lopnorensis TaxID=1352348 RepID=UPI000698C5DE|nr:serine/threonine-protein kinase [Allosalinactinospora lopnorensis]